MYLFLQKFCIGEKQRKECILQGVAYVKKGMENVKGSSGAKTGGNKKGGTSIKTQLIGFIIPSIVFIVVIMMFVSYSVSKPMITNQVLAKLDAQSYSGTYEIEAWKAENLTVIETAIRTMKDLDMTEEEILKYEESFLETYEHFPNGIYIGLSDNTMLDATGWTPDEPCTQCSWYTEALAHQATLSFGEPYVDPLTGEYVVTASCYVDGLAGKGGAVCADVGLAQLTSVVAEMDLAPEEQAFLFDGATGIILADSTTERVSLNMLEMEDTSYATIYNDIVQNGVTQSIYHTADGSEYITAHQIEGTTWYLAIGVEEDAVVEDLIALERILMIIGIAVILVECIIVYFMLSRMVNPIKQLTGVITEVTKGNFASEVNVKGTGEVAVMADSMKEFMHVMRNTLGQMINISDNFTMKAQNTSQLSEGLHGTSVGQFEAMEQLSCAVDELTKAIVEVAEGATTLAQIVTETTADGAVVSENMDATRETAARGRSDMERVTGAMDSMQVSMAELEKSIRYVGEAAEKIDEITGAIIDIAEETNLLALNASIEAARAGESGRGFAVVADQIKKLANTSSDAASEISQLIESVTNLIKQTVARSEQSMEQIKDSIQLVGVASDNYDHIFAKINETGETLDHMIKRINEVNEVATSVAAISEEQSASAEEIDSTAEQISIMAKTVRESSQEVTSDSEEVAESANDLKMEISKFQI